MHLARTDLCLDRLSLWANNCRVQGLVHVILGSRDEIVKLARNRRPECMNDTECGIAVLDCIYDYAYPADVVDLVELEVLATHLAVDAIYVLRSPAHLCGYTLQPHASL